MAGFAANLSIPTLDEKAWRASRAAHAAPAQADRGGRRAEPGRDPDRRPDRAADARHQRRAGAGRGDPRSCAARRARRTIGGIGLHLRGEVSDIFMDWLRSYRPDLVPRYEAALRARRLRAGRPSASGSSARAERGAGRAAATSSGLPPSPSSRARRLRDPITMPERRRTPGCRRRPKLFRAPGRLAQLGAPRARRPARGPRRPRARRT